MFIDGQVGDMRMEDRNVFRLVKVFSVEKNRTFSFPSSEALSLAKGSGLDLQLNGWCLCSLRKCSAPSDRDSCFV